MVGPENTALVLSGGGARGAYEAGVVAGISEVLGRGAHGRAPFSIFAGSSVGAINVTFLAAHAHRGDLAAEELTRIWSSLDLSTHLRLDTRGLLRWTLGRLTRDRLWRGERFGPSILDPSALEKVVTEGTPWDRLHRNAREGRVKALVVTALQIATGRTTMFVELSPQASFRPSRDPRRTARVEPISANHVLASAAIPLVFPARRIGDDWYADGGLRFNTPMAPAIRAGAERLVVVSLLHQHGEDDTPSEIGWSPDPVEQQQRDAHLLAYPNPAFLLGKVLNALLLDPVAYDLQVLNRFNQLVDVLEGELDPEELGRVQKVIQRSRGVPYRRIETLVFTPSRDLGQLAASYLQNREAHEEGGRMVSWLLDRAARPGASWEDDLASYVLFGGGYVRQLLELGKADVWARCEEVVEFFRER